MSKRLTATDIWTKQWFMDLSPELKCLVRYVFDNCDNAGVWTQNYRLASVQINTQQVFSDGDLLKIDEGRQFELLPNGKIFIPEFISFQYGTLSENSPAHNPVFKSIEKNDLNNRVSHRVGHRVGTTLQYKDKDKDKDKVKAKDKDKAKDTRAQEFVQQVAAFREKYTDEMLLQFCSYWTESNAAGKKMRFEMEKVFDIGRRLITWNKNQNNYGTRNGKTKSAGEITLEDLFAAAKTT